MTLNYIRDPKLFKDKSYTIHPPVGRRKPKLYIRCGYCSRISDFTRACFNTTFFEDGLCGEMWDCWECSGCNHSLLHSTFSGWDFSFMRKSPEQRLAMKLEPILKGTGLSVHEFGRSILPEFANTASFRFILSGALIYVLGDGYLACGMQIENNRWKEHQYKEETLAGAILATVRNLALHLSVFDANSVGPWREKTLEKIAANCGELVNQKEAHRGREVIHDVQGTG